MTRIHTFFREFAEFKRRGWHPLGAALNAWTFAVASW